MAEAFAEEGSEGDVAAEIPQSLCSKRVYPSATQPHCILTSLGKTFNTFARFGSQSKRVKAQTPDSQAGTWPREGGGAGTVLCVGRRLERVGRGGDLRLEAVSESEFSGMIVAGQTTSTLRRSSAKGSL